MKRLIPALIIGLSAAMPALAMDMNHAGMPAASAQASAALSTGVVKKVNKAQGKLTIRHGPLANLDMPAMTMAFRVDDPGVLDRVKPGETIRFRAEMRNDQLYAAGIEPER